MARFRLIPREERFYADFVKLADQLRVGARHIEEMILGDVPIWDKADEIKEIEHTCDFLTHGIIERLNRTFVTPIDREDIHMLARSLDDVMDAIDASAGVIRLYKIDHIRYGARELARIISASAHQVRLAVEALELRDTIQERLVEIHRLENEADRVYQDAVGRLFEEERDPVAIMKWKEVLDYLELATDKCEDCANVLEGVVVKHG